MAGRDPTGAEKRELRMRFAAAGLSTVQVALSSGSYSPLIDHSEIDSRDFAKLWVAEEIERTDTVARRNNRYIRLGTLAAVVAAAAAVIAAIPIVEQWLG